MTQPAVPPPGYVRHYPGAWDNFNVTMYVKKTLGHLIDATRTPQEEPAMTDTNITAPAEVPEVEMDYNNTDNPSPFKLDNVTLAGTTIPDTNAVAQSRAAFLNQSPTTTPSFPNETPTGAVPTLRPNPGMLRALLQPILFFTLTEQLDAFEPGDTVALQFWGEGRVMVTPLPAAAARGRIPTTFPANKIHGFIAVAREGH